MQFGVHRPIFLDINVLFMKEVGVFSRHYLASLL